MLSPFQLQGLSARCAEVDPALGRIDIDGVAHRIEPKTMAVLCVLARDPPGLVTREHLLNAVWEDEFVTEGVLSRAIHLLRRTLDDDPREPSFIETIPRRGYRLVATVADPEAPPSEPPPAREDLTLSGKPSLLPRSTPPQFSRETPLVGRSPQIALLTEALDTARQGRGTLLAVTGEAGAGKSRLGRECSVLADLRGFRVWTGRCSNTEGAPPYAPWVEVLDGLLRSLPLDSVRELLGDGAPDLAKLVPELRSILPELPAPIDLPVAESRSYLLRCLRDVFLRVADRQPLLLVLEDLHWADEATLLALEQLAPAIQTANAVILLSFRDSTALEHPLSETLERLTRARELDWIRLAGLAKSEVRSMLSTLSRRPPGEQATEFFLRETEGNPFFIEEVYRHLEAENRLFDHDGNWRPALVIEDTEVPHRARLILRRRVAILRPDSLKVLQIAASIGRRFDVDLLEAVVRDLEHAELPSILDALEEAENATLIQATVATGHGGQLEIRYRFHHELIRQTLLADLSPARRQCFHRAIAGAIESLHSEDLESHARLLAHHLDLASPAGEEEKTAHYLSLAGQQALAMGAFAAALGNFDRALELLPGDDDRRRPFLLWQRARVLRSVGRWQQALEDLGASLSLCENQGDNASVVSICRQIGHLQIWRGEVAEALLIVERGLAQVDSEPNPERCRLLAIGAWAGGGAHLIKEALAMARSLGDRKVLGETLIASSWLYQSCSKTPQHAQAANEAAKHLSACGDLWNLADALAYAETAASRLGCLSDISGPSGVSESLARRTGNRGALVNSLTASSVRLWLETGDLDQRVETVNSCLRGCAGEIPLVGLFKAWLAQVSLLQGRFADGRALAREAVELAPTPSVHTGHEWGQLFLSQCLLGEEDAAMQLLSLAWKELPTPGRTNTVGAWDRLFAVIEGLVLLGQKERAASLYPSARAALETGTIVAFDGRRLLQTIAGIAATSAREWQRAEDHFETALRQAAEIPFRSEQAEARRWYATMLRERAEPGDRDRATALRADTLRIYDELGMGYQRDRLSAAL